MGRDVFMRCLETYERICLPGIQLFQWEKIRLAMWTVIQLQRILKATSQIYCFIIYINEPVSNENYHKLLKSEWPDKSHVLVRQRSMVKYIFIKGGGCEGRIKE